MAILNTYTVHNLYGLDAYILHTMYEQDLVVARHKRTNYTCAIACYSQVSHEISQATHMQVSNLN